MPELYSLSSKTLALCLCLMAATPDIWAQDSNSAIGQAQDAFGQRTGNEEIGLYTESQVRGFSLENAGNYRMDGHYYVRAAKLPDVVLSGMAIEIGSNALATDFPAPSGIVAFRLRQPGEGQAGMTIEAGIRPQFAPMVEMKGWLTNRDRTLSAAGGAYINPHTLFADGTKGQEYAVGVVPRAQIGDFKLTGLASWNRRQFNGNYNFRSGTDALPPEVKGIKLFAPPWQRFKNDLMNFGAMADWSSTDGWESKAALFWSSSDQPQGDFSVTTLNMDGTAHSTAIAIRGQYTRSLSGEGAIGHRFAWLGMNHRLTADIRYRRTNSRSTPGQSFDLGLFDIKNPVFGPPSFITEDMVYSHGVIRQASAGLSYEAVIANRLKIQAGAQRTHYIKQVTTQGLDQHETDNRYWLYNAAIMVPMVKNWIAYLTYTRGLEEKGVAPNIAINRNEVLPAVMAKQVELGIRGRILSRVSVMAGVFDISKPTTGFDQRGYFGLLGDVRHRGAEISVSGAVTDNLTIASGAVLLDPENSGPAVEGGLVSVWPAGQSKLTAQMNMEYRLPMISCLSMDTQLTYTSPRPASMIDSFRTKATALFDLGARYRFSLYDYPMTIRFRVQNVMNDRSWSASSNATLSRVRPRAFTLTALATI